MCPRFGRLLYVSDATDETEDEYFLHTVASQSSKLIFVDLQINDKTLQMELDTEALPPQHKDF